MKVIPESYRTPKKVKPKTAKKVFKHHTQKFAAKYSEQLKKDATECERIIEKILIENKVNFEPQKPVFLIDRFYIVDFLITNQRGTRYAIEIDGGYHSTKEQKKKDKERDLLLKTHASTNTLRITNEKVLTQPLYALSEILIFIQPKPKRVKHKPINNNRYAHIFLPPVK